MEQNRIDFFSNVHFSPLVLSASLKLNWLLNLEWEWWRTEQKTKTSNILNRRDSLFDTKKTGSVINGMINN